jgi:ATP-dependent Clp protease ATP-binding subunit ClpB
MIQQMSSDDYSVVKLAVMAEVKNHFRPEFINRIDEIVVFHALGEAMVRSIARIQLESLKARLAKMDLGFEISDQALDKVSEVGFDPAFGARPLKRAIQSEIENPLSLKILEGSFLPKETILVGVEKGALVFSKK